MRQILLNNNGALVARMPRPVVEPGHVLIRVHYSLISVGTEVASLRPAHGITAEGGSVEQVKAYANLAHYYLGKAARNPDKAARKAAQLVKTRLAGLLPQKPLAPRPTQTIAVGQIEWTRQAAKEMKAHNGRLELVTDDSEGLYQAWSQPINALPGHLALVQIQGQILEGAVAFGALNETRESWLGLYPYQAGPLEAELVFDLQSSQQFTLVIANAGAGKPSQLALDKVEISLSPKVVDGLPYSEMSDQGWNVGYSAAGEVLAVGEGISDLSPGDWVMCGGAGQANHADYVSVARNLVCRVPAGCDIKWAATGTVGAIAMQGIRQASPQLGEKICVLGLGLIGQMTAQLLRANGCTVIGLDLDASRVERAKSLGMAAGADNPEALKILVRDLTEGHGADRTLITAAAKSDALINLAMEVTRRKGVVVVVGDVGLNVQRPLFYRKEIDLLISSSYGPGRYDKSYEEQGIDYPYAYVRWTLNRNMQAYLELIAAGRLNIEALIDKIVTVDEAPEAYKLLAEGNEALPLGVLIHYPADPRDLPEATDSPRITLKGHKKATKKVLNYALVGAGAFGTSMLAPQMQKRSDRFALRGVVSRRGVHGSNFARTNQVKVLATDLDEVLQDPEFDLVVIATRHHEHAGQVIRSLRAGKHVFVEKPLALSWQELDEVVKTYHSLQERPLLMVGFNRRFSPALQKLQEALRHRRSPVIINYRLNGGYIPPDSWIQDAQGGGRNLGEACHMYDVFRSLARGPVTSIQATSIDPQALPYLRNDNFCATIAYEDGSIGNLVYTALGPKQGLPKERVEVFCDGEAYLVDDYKRLIKTSDGTVLWQNNEVDKGHFEELSRFGDAIANGGESPITFEEIVETSAVALHIEDLLHGRVFEDGSEQE